MIGDFEVLEEDLAGRIGRLETAHGKIETPIFFPVINPFKKEVNIEDLLNNFRINNIITNAYLLYKKGIHNISVHQFLNFNGVIMLDSGAYQILQYGNIEIDNKTIVKYQLEVKPDIGVILDLPTGNTDSRETAKMTVEETIRRAKEAEELIGSQGNDIIWVHPIQGGKYLDLLQYSSIMADKNEMYKMLALGSPTVLLKEYDYVDLIRMVFIARSSIKRSKPLHLFGGGLPHIIPFVIALGVDSFDSASYVLYARDNRYITRDRVLKLEEMDEFPCSCPICSKYTVKEVREMNEIERDRLLAMHNLYVILEEIKEVKVAIKEGRLFDYLQEKAKAHPSLNLAFKELLKYLGYLEKYDDRVKGQINGLFFFDGYSLQRPEVLRYNNYLTNKMKRKKEKALVLVNKGNLERPYIRQPVVKQLINRFTDYDIYVIDSVFKIVPVHISESYPLSQYESSISLTEEDLDKYVEYAKTLLSSKGYSEIKIITSLHINSL